MRDDASSLRRLEDAYRRAAAADEAERAAVLDDACGDDRELRRRVERMLELEEQASGFLESSLPELIDDGGDDGNVGRVVGRWHLVELLGAGGMGAVYVAERADGAYEQRAALKLIAAHVAGAEPRRRFLHERQILASLEHPNIARLLDGGVTDGGQPYLVMEHVVGRPIDEHCRVARSSIRQRLLLFRQVCDAVRHAHGQLIVHRDLKPSNIMVDADGAVKLLDFGIAKVMGDEDAEVTITAEGAGPLTPAYASPEQISGGRATAASDVYALGVVLYELLTERRPYDVDTGSRAEYERAIETQEPAKPSAALEKDDPAARRALRGDLDTIVLAALRREPERRYGSVEQLSEDVRRHLDGLPVLARPDTVGYRAGKFVRRNGVAVAGAAAVAVALIAGIIGTSWQARRAESAQHDAELARDDAEAVNMFLFNVFRAGDPRAGGESMTIREAMDHAAVRVGAELADRPRAEASARLSIGTTYRTLTALDEAEPHLERAVELYEQQEGPDDLETLNAVHELALLRWDQGRLDAAEEHARRAYERRRDRLGPDDPRTIESLTALARIAETRGDDETAVALTAEALAARQRIAGPADPALLVARKNHAMTLSSLGRNDEAAAELEAVLAMQEQSLGAEHLDTLVTVTDLATVYSRLDRSDESITTFRRAQRGMAAQLPPDHMDLLITEYNLGTEIERAGRLDEAMSLFASIRDRAAGSLGEAHWLTCVAAIRVASGMVETGRLDEAAGELERVRRLAVQSEAPPWVIEFADAALGRLAERRAGSDEAGPVEADSPGS